MKRYLLFGCEQYESSGGWFDFLNDYDSLDDSIEAARRYKERKQSIYCHIVDTQLVESDRNGHIVWAHGRDWNDQLNVTADFEWNWVFNRVWLDQ